MQYLKSHITQTHIVLYFHIVYISQTYTIHNTKQHITRAHTATYIHIAYISHFYTLHLSTYTYKISLNHNNEHQEDLSNSHNFQTSDKGTIFLSMIIGIIKLILRVIFNLEHNHKINLQN
jgi:hypothetical protein